MGLPQHIREAILQDVFYGALPAMNLEGLYRPPLLGNLCLVSRQIYSEATEAFFSVCLFEVDIITAVECSDYIRHRVDWGQPPVHMGNAILQFRFTWAELLRNVARAQPLSVSGRNLSWGYSGFFRMLVFTSVVVFLRIRSIGSSERIALGLFT
jgi:hypothetical protein